MYSGDMNDPVADPAADIVVYAGRFIRRVRREIGVSAAYRVLSMLDEVGPVGVSQLAVADGTSQPTMSAQIAALVADGLVSKQPHPSDARASVVTLTDLGRQRLAEHRHRIADSVRGQLASYSPDEIATALAVLRTLTEKGTM